MTNANLLLHPVRLRILQTLVGSEPLTTAQLRDRLPDVPPATMYRHIATLTKAGVLEVVGEKKVRGTVERSYQVRQDGALVDEDARTAMTPDDHRQAFTAFSGAMMSDFERYLSRDGIEPASDGLMYRQGAVWLTREEYEALVEEIQKAVTSRTTSTPGDGRTRHLVSIVVVPDELGQGADGDDGADRDDRSDRSET
ncbi:helix-turn-helix domain-containing protein [Streptomyces daliensis]|uniref:Helix-turn-helix domain-containing protein n=1 Tax=Streptomyces daliensis TaxID=299421 RepID=A0A8T4IZN6_9ACTN|nr:helix-turn-helix domain-containing protein [Streptomyces daliensis]